MSAARALAAVAIATVASLVLALALRDALPSQAQEVAGEPDPEIGIEWAYRPADLPDLVKESPATVVAEVVAIEPGPPVGADAESDGFPTERVRVRVIETIDGNTPTVFTLYKTGGEGLHAEGDPAYEVGERDLLFVRRRLTDDLSAPNPDGTWIPAAPDGRLLVEGGYVEPLIEGPVGDELEGESVDGAAAEIEAAESEGAK